MHAKRFGAIAVSLSLLAGTGCSTMSNTGRGAALGGAVGAGLGTAIGAATGDPATGAVAGGLLGAGVGGIAGSEADADERRDADIRRAELEAAQAHPAMSIDDVIQMSRPNPNTNSRVSDEVIIDYIRSSNSRFNLSPGDITYLTSCGVSDGVIREMMRSRTATVLPAAPRTVVVREPAPPVIVYERPWGSRHIHYCPPPPPPVGFGIHWHN